MDNNCRCCCSEYDPPAGLLQTRTYAVQVNPGGTPDCGVATWANICRKVIVLGVVNYGTLTSGDQTYCTATVNPENITFSTLPSGGSGTYSYQWYYQNNVAANCPTGTSTAGWTIIAGATNDSYDPPAGLTVSRTYAVQVNPTGSPDCGPATWASGCRKISLQSAGNSDVHVSGVFTYCNSFDGSTIVDGYMVGFRVASQQQ
jgi:hypothetical protein